jgi:Aspartyl protease
MTSHSQSMIPTSTPTSTGLKIVLLVAMTLVVFLPNTCHGFMVVHPYLGNPVSTASSSLSLSAAPFGSRRSVLRQESTTTSSMPIYIKGSKRFYSPVIMTAAATEEMAVGDTNDLLPVSHTNDKNDKNDDDNDNDVRPNMTVLRAPLKFIGPYPCLGLRFPNLATSSQRQRNVTGVSLDFVLDTAANTNTIQGAVAKELQLSIVGQALPGVGSAGYLAGAPTFALGDAQLEGGEIDGRRSTTTTADEKSKEEIASVSTEDSSISTTTMTEPLLLPSQTPPPMTFIQGLTASALPIASPAAAGLLSLPFFQCFEGGVEFCWQRGSSSIAKTLFPMKQFNNDDDHRHHHHNNNNNRQDESYEDTPFITFFGDENGDDVVGRHLAQHLARVELRPLPVTQLPSVMVRINGIDILALLDTGSPITVLNQQAADLAGITTTATLSSSSSSSSNNNNNNRGKPNKFKNPFASMAEQFQEAQALSQAAARGEVLTILGTNGQPTRLYKSIETATVSMPSKTTSTTATTTTTTMAQLDETGENAVVPFGPVPVYVGELPGLAALNGLMGVESPPAVVLGMDVLRTRPTMFLRARTNEVYF